MKRFLLSILPVLFFITGQSQTSQVETLPAGKYETYFKANQNKWERGDIILINDTQYRVSTSHEIGEYRFSVTAQRIFFTSGPLKSHFAKTSFSNNSPAIVLPVAENAQQGLKLPAEVWGYYKQ